MIRQLFAFAAVTTSLVALETDARACGGCFHPPEENPTVVTDHRMIFTISSTQSTLYNQIEYTGSPSSFAWVLPYAGDVEIGLSSDYLFGYLDGQTSTTIIAPEGCPPPPVCSFGANSSSGSAVGGFSDAGSVTVLSHEVVGPYDTVKLSATDANALQDWLSKNGYAIPDSVKPVVAAYQAEHFNFLALKLVPGKDVQDMRPVRVTTQGSNVALPLRMVAAGTGAKVGITLWVVAEGRYQPQNFDSYIIKSEDLTWDWTTVSSDYTTLRDQKNAAGNGRIWEVESSDQLNTQFVKNVFNYQTNSIPGYPAAYDDEKSDAGTVTRTAMQERDDDVDAFLATGGNGNEVRVTRLRADLSHAALDQDLLLSATQDQAVLSRVRQVTKAKAPPVCPTYPPCPTSGDGGNRPFGAGPNTVIVGGGDGCSTTSTSTPWGWLGGGIAVFLSVLARKRKRS